jgi:ABC-type branched-subunit amino acid transport system substrate-binding protein
VSRVYISLPLSGPSAVPGRDVLRGAELALEAAENRVDWVVLDSAGENREHRAVENARRAARDADALAYLGDFHSSQVLETAPILGEAGLLQIAPVATYIGLGGPTLIRLLPHDGVGSRAVAHWLVREGVTSLLVAHDHDRGYGIPVGALCAEAAKERGVEVRLRPVWDDHESPTADLGDAQAFLYVGVAGSGAPGLWWDLHGANPALWLLGSEGVAQAWFARELSDSMAERTRFFVAARAPLAFYGYEGMALILDAVAQEGYDRAAIARVARATRDRASIIGRYSIDDDGHTTATAYGRLAVADGKLAWDGEQSAA